MISSVQNHRKLNLKFKQTLRRAGAAYHKQIFTNRADVVFDNGAFSFTFDDIPQTTVSAGAPILNNLDVKGTFYISGQLASGRRLPSIDENFASMDEVSQLHAMGHDIGCHTYSHYMLRKGSASELKWDAFMNRMELAKHGIHVKHFAFPYGAMSIPAKKLLGLNYSTMRSTYPGINYGRTDLRCLLVHSLYSNTLNKERIKAVVDKTIELKGWSIFYTHGVETSPNQFGCTPKDLRWAIQTCMEAGGKVLSVDEASKFLD